MLGAAWLECPGHSSRCIAEPAGARGALCTSTGSSLWQLQAGVHPWRMRLSPPRAGEVGKGSGRGVPAARASPDKLFEAELIRGGDGPATSGNSFRVFLA